MPDAGQLTSQICGFYNFLRGAGPFVAMLVVAGTLFMGIVTKNVPMGVIIFAILAALVLGSLPIILAGLPIPVRVGC